MKGSSRKTLTRISRKSFHKTHTGHREKTDYESVGLRAAQTAAEVRVGNPGDAYAGTTAKFPLISSPLGERIKVRGMSMMISDKLF